MNKKNSWIAMKSHHTQVHGRQQSAPEILTQLDTQNKSLDTKELETSVVL